MNNRYKSLGIRTWIISNVRVGSNRKKEITTTTGKRIYTYTDQWLKKDDSFKTEIFERNNGENQNKTYWTNI